MSHRKLAVLLLILTVILSACGQPAAPAQAPVADAAPSDTPQPTEPPTATVDAAATQSVQQTAEAQAVRATEFAGRQTATAEFRHAAATEKAGVPLTATAEAEAAAEAKQAAFQAVVDQLHEEGVIGWNTGDYYPLGDFEYSQAQINTPFIYYLQFAAYDFIISADLEWESASDNANWPTSGCGFIYGYKDRYNADITFLGLDGYTHSLQYREDRPIGQFAFQKWGEPERPKGSAKIMLVMADKRVSVYVNDALANEFYNSLYQGGDLGLNVFSGTNKSYGTRCTFSDVQLYLPPSD